MPLPRIEAMEAYNATLHHWNNVRTQECRQTGSVSEATEAAYKEALRCKCENPVVSDAYPMWREKHCIHCYCRLYHLENTTTTIN